MPHIERARAEVYTLVVVTALFFLLIPFSQHTCPWVKLLPYAVLILSLLLMRRHPGIVQLMYEKDNPQPSITVIPILVFCSAGAFTGHGNIADGSVVGVWCRAICIAAGLTLLMWYCCRHISLKAEPNNFAFILFAASFVGDGYYMVADANVIFDNSATEYFEATVSGKKLTVGKHVPETYYLDINTREHPNGTEPLQVPKWLFDEVREGYNIGLYYRKGALGIPWYEGGRIKR